MSGEDIIDMTQMLIDNGADVNQVEGPDIAATVPLLLVCNSANFRMDFIALDDRVTLATMLINAGARVDTLDGTGKTALMYAVDNPPLIRVLIDAGASPNVMPADMTHTPLTIACTDPDWFQRGGPTRIEVVNMMIGANADVNLQLATGGTAITAASDGPNDVVCALLAAGATPPVLVERTVRWGITTVYMTPVWVAASMQISCLAFGNTQTLAAAGFDIRSSSDYGSMTIQPSPEAAEWIAEVADVAPIAILAAVWQSNTWTMCSFQGVRMAALDPWLWLRQGRYDHTPDPAGVLAASINYPDVIQHFVRTALLPWRPTYHATYSAAFRAAVWAVLLSANRHHNSCRADCLPFLPNEMWLCIFSHLPRAPGCAAPQSMPHPGDVRPRFDH